MFKQILAWIWAVGGTTILMILAALLQKFLKKLHLEVSSAQADAIINTAQRAIRYVEEIAASAPNTMTPTQKLAFAVEHVVQQHPNAVRNDVEIIVQSLLSDAGLGATIAKTSVGVSAPLKIATADTTAKGS